jgi:hypothetical protein
VPQGSSKWQWRSEWLLARLGAAWTLKMADRARSEPLWRSKWLLKPASVL